MASVSIRADKTKKAGRPRPGMVARTVTALSRKTMNTSPPEETEGQMVRKSRAAASWNWPSMILTDELR